jgi:hypothetical protein
MSAIQRREPPPLPATLDQWQRKNPFQRNINDEVEHFHRKLLGPDSDPELRERYNDLLYPVWDIQAVNGSCTFDDCKLAEMIQQAALAEDPNHFLGREKLAAIAKAHKVVLRRYNQSRDQRREMIDGEVSSSDNSHSQNNS